MPEEITLLQQGLEAVEEMTVMGFSIYQGQLEGQAVLLAQCGIGKVNAALLTMLLVQQGAEQIIFTGVAGGLAPSLSVGDIVVSADAMQHDVDVSALGYRLGHIPDELIHWPADPQLRALALACAQELADVHSMEGRIVSGDQFVADRDKVVWLRQTFQACCVEMEGASVAQVCSRCEVPFVIIRSISDTADYDASLSFQEFTPLAAERANRLVRAMLQRWPATGS